jgi:hypothetical protein
MNVQQWDKVERLKKYLLQFENDKLWLGIRARHMELFPLGKLDVPIMNWSSMPTRGRQLVYKQFGTA